MTKKNINTQEYLEYVLNNAFDFLERAIDQYKKEPKYSVINFCSAIELFLKSKLLKEHWSLVVAHKTMPDIQNFVDGDFRSEDFKDLIPKIKKVFREEFSTNLEECFNELAKNRNRMIHFYHNINTPNSTEEEIENLVAKQSTAWKYLKELFDKWNDIFSKYSSKILDLDNKMNSLERRNYLEKKFKKIKTKLDKLKSEGKNIVKCELCGYESVIDITLTDMLHKGQCLVCDDKYVALLIKCPNDQCNKNLLIKNNKFPIKIIECPKCGEVIDIDYLKECLNTRTITKDNYDEITEINCAECCSSGTGIVHGDYYLCLNCLNYSKDAASCEWCNEQTIGKTDTDMSDSYSVGCDFCEGHLGWHSDKD